MVSVSLCIWHSLGSLPEGCLTEENVLEVEPLDCRILIVTCHHVMAVLLLKARHATLWSLLWCNDEPQALADKPSGKTPVPLSD